MHDKFQIIHLIANVTQASVNLLKHFPIALIASQLLLLLQLLTIIMQQLLKTS